MITYGRVRIVTRMWPTIHSQWHAFQVFSTLGHVSGSPEEKAAATLEMLAPGGAAAKKLAAVERLIAASDSEFYLGDSLTLADVLAFCFIGWLTSGCGHLV